MPRWKDQQRPGRAQEPSPSGVASCSWPGWEQGLAGLAAFVSVGDLQAAGPAELWNTTPEAPGDLSDRPVTPAGATA